MNNQNNPLHGIKLKDILIKLESHYGFEELSKYVPVRCFLFDPTINSSLKFLRNTDNLWARKKVENLYLELLEKS